MQPLPRALRGEIATIQRDFIYPSHDGSEAWPRDEVLLEEGGYGYRRWDVYTRLMQDAHVGAVFQQRWGVIVGREWKVEPGGTSRKAKKAAEMVEAQLKAMATRIPKEQKNDLIVGPASAFEEAILGLQSSILYGLAAAENIWDQDGSEVYIQSMFPRDIRRFLMVSSPNGYQLRLRSVDSPMEGLKLHPTKFTVARYCLAPTEDPWGLGKGSQLFYPTWAKRNAAKFWLIFADKMGNPTAIAKVPNSASREKRGSVLAMLDAIASDSGIVIDADVVIDFVEAQARGSNSTHAALIDWANAEISKAILGETGTIDQSVGGGSRARDEVANEQRLEVAKSDADMLSSVLNRTLLRHITNFNFGPEVETPRIWWQFPELEERLDRQKEAGVVFSLAGAGFVPTREWVEERFDIELAEEEAATSPLEGLFGGGDGGGGTPPAPGGEPVAPGGVAPGGDVVEDQQAPAGDTLASLGFAEPHDHADTVDYYAKQAMGTGVGGALDRVAQLIDGATDLREVQQRLPEVMSATSSDFAEQLGQAIAAAELAGRWEVLEEIEQAEALDTTVIDNAEEDGEPAKKAQALPENPTPEQLAAIVTAIAREEFEPDAVLAGPVEFTPQGWQVLYNANGGQQFLLEWNGSTFLKGVPGVQDEEAPVDMAESLDFAAKGKGKRKTPKCNPGKSHLCRSANGSGSCVSLGKKCKYKGSPAAQAAAGYVASKGGGGGGATPAAAPAPMAAPKVAKAPKAPKTPKTGGGATPPVAAAKGGGGGDGSPVKLNQSEMDSKRAELIKFVGKGDVDKAEKAVKKILDAANTGVYVRVGSTSTLDQILGGGFKTAHELGRTDHQIPHLKDDYLKARARVEAKSLGYAEKGTKPGDRPIYGYLGGRNMDGAAHADVGRDYGSIAIRLKDDVKDRSTFTGADSFKSGIASPLKGGATPPPPNAAALIYATRHGYDIDKLPGNYPDFYGFKSPQAIQVRAAAKAKTIDDLAKSGAATGAKYVEAQVHGGVKASDIGEIHFSPRGASDRPSASVAQFAKDNKVPVFISGKKLSDSDLDDLIAPPADRRAPELRKLSDALETKDFAKVVDIAAKMADEVKTVKLATGENDSSLKLLYQKSGFDGLPRVGTKKDLDDLSASGATMAIRGTDPRGTGTKQLDEFKSGAYFTGNGIYGNGTYISNSGTVKGGSFVHGNSDSSRKRAVNDVAKHGYVSTKTLNYRMALDPAAKVVTQSAIKKEIDDFSQGLSAWAASQKKSILAGSAATMTAKAFKKEYDINDPSRTGSYSAKLPGPITRKLGALDSVEEYTIPPRSMLGKPIKVYILNDGGDAGKYLINPDDPNSPGVKIGTNQVWPAKPTSIAQLRKVPGAMERGGFGPVNMTAVTPAQRQVLGDLDRKVGAANDLLTGDRGGGASGRFAVARGYDAIALDRSYQPDSFMNLLNRTVVTVQDKPIAYGTAQRLGV